MLEEIPVKTDQCTQKVGINVCKYVSMSSFVRRYNNTYTIKY